MFSVERFIMLRLYLGESISEVPQSFNFFVSFVHGVNLNNIMCFDVPNLSIYNFQEKSLCVFCFLVQIYYHMLGLRLLLALQKNEMLLLQRDE